MGEGYKEPQKCENLEELFKSWRNCQKDLCEEDRGKSFTSDGFLGDEEEFKRQDERVLYILKEANSKNADETLRIEDGGFWAHRVINRETDEKPGELLNTIRDLQNIIIIEEKTDDISVLKHAAYMNLDKRGGSNSSDKQKIKEYVDKFEEYIIKEINIINPTIIIECGTYSFMESIHARIKCKKIVDMWHPGYSRFLKGGKKRYMEEFVKRYNKTNED